MNDTIDGCICQINNCLSCFWIYSNKRICTQYNDIFYPIENEQSNIEGYHTYYRGPKKGYYLDNNIFRKCYKTCETCEIKGDKEMHNCIKCNKNYLFNISVNNYLNCYENYSQYNHYYTDTANVYNYAINSSFPIEYTDLIRPEYIRYNITSLKQEISKINKTIEIKENETKYYDTIIKNIEDIFTSGNYDLSNLDKGEDEIVITTDKMAIILTTTINQKNKLNENITIINLGDCEEDIRNYYHLRYNDIIYIKKQK